MPYISSPFTGKMLAHKDHIILILLEICIVTAHGLRVDTGKKSSVGQSSYSSESSNGKDTFNPGHAQHGGWHKPEDEFVGSPGGNQWYAGELGSYNTDQDQDQPTLSRQSEGHGTSYNPGPSGIKSGATGSYSVVGSQQFSDFGGGSLNSGGDLIVGQGSVQRPANAGSPYHSSSGLSHSSASFPVQAHIGPGTSQFSQVISSNSKKPSFSASEQHDYVQQSSGGNVYNPSQAKPGQNQYFGNKITYSGQAQQPSFVQHSFGQQSSPGLSANKYPSKPGIRPSPSHQTSQVVSSKPSGIYKPDVYLSQSGSRFPGQKPSHFPVNSGLRGGSKIPVSTGKFPVQFSQQFPQTSNQGVRTKVVHKNAHFSP